MEKLYEDASREPSCASAVSNLFEYQEENCRCWRAMNATYRQENYNCRPDANMRISLNEQYELDNCEGRQLSLVMNLLYFASLKKVKKHGFTILQA